MKYPYSIYGATGTMTMREVAGHIAALHGGNWIITDNGYLKLVYLALNATLLGTESGEIITFGDGVSILA